MEILWNIITKYNKICELDDILFIFTKMVVSDCICCAIHIQWKRMDCFHFSFLFTNEHGGRKMVVNYHNEPGIDFTNQQNVESFKE